MNCKLKVLNQDSGSKVIIPTRATIEQMGEFLVYLIENNKVTQRRIIPGTNLGKYLIVRRDLIPVTGSSLKVFRKCTKDLQCTVEDSLNTQASSKP